MRFIPKLGSLLIAATSFITALSLASPIRAQALRCYQVSDPDGWTNIRELSSRTVAATADSGAVVPIGYFDGDLGVIQSPHGAYTIHRSRLTQLPSSARCPRAVVVEQDGYLNLRKSPNGEIITRIYNGTALLLIGDSDQRYWERVLTPSGQTGFVYGRGLEVYTGR